MADKKYGSEWAKLWGVVVYDPDGFGERTEGMPRYSYPEPELMTEKEFMRGCFVSTCKYEQPNRFFKRWQTYRGWIAGAV